MATRRSYRRKLNQASKQRQKQNEKTQHAFGVVSPQCVDRWLNSKPKRCYT